MMPQNNTNLMFQGFSFQKEVPSRGSRAGDISQTSCPRSGSGVLLRPLQPHRRLRQVRARGADHAELLGHRGHGREHLEPGHKYIHIYIYIYIYVYTYMYTHLLLYILTLL